MLLITQLHSFILLDIHDTSNFCKVCCTKRNKQTLQQLLYKFMKQLQANKEILQYDEYTIDCNISCYKIEVKPYDIDNTEYTNEEVYYYDYILNTYNLYGFIRIPREEVLSY